jgi:hypothetical protein
MSANDDATHYETADRQDAESEQNGAVSRDVTPPRCGYQNLFRAVCLKNRKVPVDPA